MVVIWIVATAAHDRTQVYYIIQLDPLISNLAS
jgi:hypothetical protein